MTQQAAPQISWICKKFEELTPFEVYQFLWLRNEVFVVEQNCVFQDADYKDQHCHHLMGFIKENQLAVYARIVPPGLSYNEMAIGRVVANPQCRSKGLGKALMQKAIQTCYDLYGAGDIKIGAQCYLKKFYTSFGFAQSSDVYLEDNIEHIEMILSAPK